MQVRGPCANHPNRPGAWLMEDGSMRCDPCYYRRQGRIEAAETIWAKAKQLRAEFRTGQYGIEYVNGFEDAFALIDPE